MPSAFQTSHWVILAGRMGGVSQGGEAVGRRWLGTLSRSLVEEMGCSRLERWERWEWSWGCRPYCVLQEVRFQSPTSASYPVSQNQALGVQGKKSSRVRQWAAEGTQGQKKQKGCLVQEMVILHCSASELGWTRTGWENTDLVSVLV